MEDGWKWKHINRSTIRYKLLHKFDKLLDKGIFSASQLQNTQQTKRIKKREVSIGVKRLKSQEQKAEKGNRRERFKLERCSGV